NVNSSTPPSWAGDLATGPLFEPSQAPPPGLVDELVEGLLAESPRGSVQIDWHLSERDWLPQARGRLHRIVQRALAGAPLAFVFARPRKPLDLAEGIDRGHPAVLMSVALHLPRLAVQTGSRDPERLLAKLGSLARMALSAGMQKRAFLRRQGRD